MKILKTAMLSLLAVTCAVAVTIAVFHFSGGERDTDSRDRTRSVANNEETEEPEDVDVSVNYVEPERADFRLLRRAASISAETGLWQFFPSIPYFEVLPGETAVLSVSATGFAGWEVDTAFANVELFDKKTDDENAYVSFIMPDEEVSIAALYADEIPQINFDNQMEMIMSRRNNREFGDFTAASSEIQPFPVDPTPITWQVNRPMNLTIRNPAIVAEEGLSPQDAQWVFPPFFPDGTTPNALPTGLTFLPAGIQGGILLTGTPTVVGSTSFYFFIYDRSLYNPLTPDIGFIGMYVFSFTVVMEPPSPSIITPTVPDAMVDVWYEVLIQTMNFPINTTPPLAVWELVPDAARILPAGLDVYWDDTGDMSLGYIRGTPSTAGPAAFNFTIRVQQTNEDRIDYGDYVDSPIYSIRVWDRPGLSYIQTLSGVLTPTPAPGPYAFLDGMVGFGYGNGAAIAAVDIPAGIIGTWEYRIVNNGLPASSGLALNATSGLVAGTNPVLPTTGNTYTFDVVYTSARTDLIIGSTETVTFTLRIWPQPVFTTDSRLPDGMDSRPLYTPEPPDDPYTASIIATGLDINTSPSPPVTWSWVVVPGDLPPNTTFSMSGGNGLIQGFIQNTGTSGDYDFDVDIVASSPLNPNIDGATITREFSIWVWNRTYLYIDPLAGATDRFVRRMPATPGGAFEVDWEPDTWGGIGTDADMYRLRRAVMPGTYGQIRVPNPTGFTRWEVMPTPGSAGAYTSIADNWGFSANNALSYVQIRMPDFSGTNIVAGDVYIAGYPATPPDGLWTVVLNPGTLGDVSSGGFIRFDGVLGAGGRAIFWGDYTLPNPPAPANPQRKFPPGMSFSTGSGNATFITSDIPGGPTEVGVFTFTLGINLPGSMRIQRDFTFTVDAVPDIMLGDVDGSGSVTLVDLILLDKRINDPSFVLTNPNAANIETPTGSNPTTADLRRLTQYFAVARPLR